MKNKLYRGDGCIGGVCKRIANFTQTSVIIWRFIFLFIPCGFWAYIILWILLEDEN